LRKLTGFPLASVFLCGVQIASLFSWKAACKICSTAFMLLYGV